MKGIFKSLVLVIFIHLSVGVCAQFNIEFNISVFEDSPKGTRISIASSVIDSPVKNRLVKSSGVCKLSLNYNDLYVIKVEKKGYVTKVIEVNSDVPESVLSDGEGFPSKTIKLKLYPNKKDVNIEIFEQPVIKIAYDRNYDDFVRDKEYELALSKRIMSVEEELTVTDFNNADLAVVTSPKVVKIPDVVNPSKKSVQKRDKTKQVQKPVVVRKASQQRIKSGYKSVYSPTNVKDIDDVYAGSDISDDAPYIKRFPNLNDVQLQLINEQYNNLILKADKAFNEKEYLISRYYYKQAIYLKGEEDAVKERLSEIIVKIEEKARNRFDERYSYLLNKANEYYERKSYLISRYFYNLAKEMKSDDDFVNLRLRKISASLRR